MKRIKAELASNSTLEGYGKYISVKAQEIPDAKDEIQTYRGQLSIMDNGAMQIGICVAQNRPYVVETLEQHIESSELLVALDGDFVTPVTSSIEVDGKLYPDMDKIRAIRVNKGEGLVFDKGIWHWTPYAITDTCSVLVGFKKDTPDLDFVTNNLEKKIVIDLK